MGDRSVERAKNRAHDLLEALEARLAAGEINEEGWYRECQSLFTPAYLAGDNPRAQSGSGSDEAGWERSRRLIADAIGRDGAFLDVGCASGLLMECVERWAGDRGCRVEAHGLDIAPELADLARRRLPDHAARIHTGNVMHWEPPRRYDFVRTGLEYVPMRRERDLVERLLDRFVAPEGRLIIGAYAEERDETREGPSVEQRLSEWGFPVAGRSERPHKDLRLVQRVVWIEDTRG